MTIHFHKLSENKNNLIYVVICARYQGKWIFVRQKTKTTWEIPGGHINQNELPDDAARRELIEETGAEKFDLISICDFSVEEKDDKIKQRLARLYFAEVAELGALGDFEIEEIILSDEMPQNRTYEKIQLCLFKKVLQKINNITK